MLRTLRTKWQKYKEQRKTENYETGFGWAMVSYYLHHEPLDHIVRQCDTAFDFDEFDEFDEGILEACRIIKDL